MGRGQTQEHDEVLLTGRLAEFRTALEKEIEAARRSESSSAVPLVNGRRIAQVGGSFQYAFEVESLLNLPGDAPGDLYVPGHPLQEAVIISIDGMTITLSVPVDLGRSVPNARLQSNLAQLMRKLIERIEKLSTGTNPVGDRVLGDSQPAGQPASVHDSCLNANQQEALASSLGRDTTFIWGPPGTGKTQTIGAIGEHLYRGERSVLLVSHTNTAVDQAILRIADKIDADELAAGRVLRVGEPHDKRLKEEKYNDVLLRTHTERRSAELTARLDACKAQRTSEASEVIRLAKIIDIIQWVREAGRDIECMSAELSEVCSMENSTEEARKEVETLRSETRQRTEAAEAARVAKENLASIGRLDTQIDDAAAVLNSADVEFNAAQAQVNEEEKILNETLSANWITRRWRGLPSPVVQRDKVADLSKLRGAAWAKRYSAQTRLNELTKHREDLADEVESFSKEHAASPDEVIALAEEHYSRIRELQTKINVSGKECADRRQSLEEVLARRLAVLRDLELTTCDASDAQAMFEAVEKAYQRAAVQVLYQDLSDLEKQRDSLNESIRGLDEEIRQIEESLQQLEEIVIAEAAVVATTLTRAYLRDSIQDRRFDTIILDEASMAPMPAMWVAASVAETNAVIVGDFRQLPPIVISEHDLAQKWLGRDIFDQVGLNETLDSSGRRVDLLEQHRMHPEISAIPNKLVYAGRLKDAAGMDSKGEEHLRGWYRGSWGHDHPVLLVDTGSVGAWVTSVSRGSRASRLNFLSATICADLASSLLREDRQELPDGDPPRILIGCPYRPHAKLLNLLVEDEDVKRDVHCGTAHSFQGSEADVVILDLVNDEPHWRVAIFMPDFDEDTRRLLNVALTRARRRLIVVGDFAYIQKKAKRAFLGQDRMALT